MLACRARHWRYIRTLDTSTLLSRHLRRDGLSAYISAQHRSLQTSTNRKVETQPTRLLDENSGLQDTPWKGKSREGTPWNRSAQKADRKKKERAIVTNTWLGKRDPNMTPQERTARTKELQYLKDPLEVANFVKKELGKDKAKEMLQLVRMASHSMQCIVSWNHIINYHLERERISEAMKVYNEMKKRAQFPDSHTYTILLRGFSNNAQQSGILSKAIAVYHSMSAPNSRVQPSIIHTNAALRVCARVLDMDALWGIVGKIPETGPGAADTVTFTTILNAIRQALIVNVPPGELDKEVAARRERGVVEGRRIWEDVVSKWRNADIAMEEDLVCAMGRLLLIGSRPRDWDDVLSLVEQTMDIPRLVPRLGTAPRQDAGFPRLRGRNIPDEYRFDDDHLGPGGHPMRGDEFLALTRVGTATSSPLKYATPSNNALSLIQESCQKIVANKAAAEYWSLLTDPTSYGVVPDVNNLHQRLRVLRLNRASAAAARTLKEDFVERGNEPRPGTFRIAMSTCVRDKNNHNSLKHANQILQIMLDTLPDADVKTVAMYAELAFSFPLAKGDDLVDALTLLQPVVNNIRLQLGVGAEPKFGQVGAAYLTGEERQDALIALRKVYRIYDRLLLSNLIVEEKKGPFKVERARLGAFIQRKIFKDGSGKWDESKEAIKAMTDEGEEQPRSKRWGAHQARPREKKSWSSPLDRNDDPVWGGILQK